MHQIKKIRALYLVYFFMKFDKMKSVFNFVHVWVGLKWFKITAYFSTFFKFTGWQILLLQQYITIEKNPQKD